MKKKVDDKKVYENKNDIFGDYEGECELIGDLNNGEQIRKSQIRVRNINNYEAYFNAIDMESDSEDSTLQVFFWIKHACVQED